MLNSQSKIIVFSLSMALLACGVVFLVFNRNSRFELPEAPAEIKPPVWIKNNEGRIEFPELKPLEEIQRKIEMLKAEVNPEFELAPKDSDAVRELVKYDRYFDFGSADKEEAGVEARQSEYSKADDESKLAIIYGNDNKNLEPRIQLGFLLAELEREKTEFYLDHVKKSLEEFLHAQARTEDFAIPVQRKIHEVIHLACRNTEKAKATAQSGHELGLPE